MILQKVWDCWTRCGWQFGKLCVDVVWKTCTNAALHKSLCSHCTDFNINCRLLLGVVAPSLSLSFVPSGVPWLRIISTIYVSNQLLEGDIIMCINKN